MIRVYKTIESGFPYTASYRRVPIYGTGDTPEQAKQALLKKARTLAAAIRLMKQWPN